MSELGKIAGLVRSSYRAGQVVSTVRVSYEALHLIRRREQRLGLNDKFPVRVPGDRHGEGRTFDVQLVGTPRLSGNSVELHAPGAHISTHRI